MQNKGVNNELRKTLRQLQIKDSSKLGLDVLEYSPPDPASNTRVYRDTNLRLLHLERKKRLKDILHVTGEMRALNDPLHQRVVREIWEQRYEGSSTACYIYPELRADAAKIWKYNMEHWERNDWRSHLGAFDLVANGAMRLYSTSKMEKIHYSVFGDSMVLLQSHHHHPNFGRQSVRSNPKHVWLLDSTKLASPLKERAERIVSRSEYLHPSIFKKFISSISSLFSLHVLFTLREAPLTRKKADEGFRRIKSYNQTDIQNLRSIGFIRDEGSLLKMTEDGMQYLETTGQS